MSEKKCDACGAEVAGHWWYWWYDVVDHDKEALPGAKAPACLVCDDCVQGMFDRGRVQVTLEDTSKEPYHLALAMVHVAEKLAMRMMEAEADPHDNRDAVCKAIEYFASQKRPQGR